MKPAVLIVILVALAGASCLRRPPRLAPIVCPVAPPPPPSAIVGPFKIDGPPPASLTRGPYTVVLDERIVAVVRNEADTVDVGRTWQRIDPATIKELEFIRAPVSSQRYPGATGDVLRITRCYPSASHGAQPQGVGSVRGTIRFESGAPLVNATIWTPGGRGIGDALSDPFGRFRVDSLPVGSVVIEAICPFKDAFSLAAPVAVRRTIQVDAKRESELNATIPRDACVPIPPRDVRVHWRGWYSAAFESMSFRPCPVDSLAREVRGYGHPFGRKAWVYWPSTAWRQPGLGKLAADTLGGAEFGFVEFSGILHGPAPSGHMGMSNYQLLVDSVFAIAPEGRC